MFEEHQDIIDQAKWKAEAKELLLKAVEELHRYSHNSVGLPDWLGAEIEAFLDKN